MFTIKTLQQRLIIFLILPVAAFLTAIGVGGYLYIRGSLYQEWQEAAILRLERAPLYGYALEQAPARDSVPGQHRR